MWRLGKCTNATFGSTVVDIVPIKMAIGVSASREIIGGSSRALDGTLNTDLVSFGDKPVGKKRTWQGDMKPYAAQSTWWSALRLFEMYPGPWMLYDGTRPSLLSDQQRLLTSWTNSSGTALTPAADGRVSLTSSGTAWMGGSTVTDRTKLCPVTVGSQYFCGATVYGTGSWTASLTLAWFGAGTTAIGTSSLGGWTAASALSKPYILDGSLRGSRVGGAATAPPSATHVQARWTISGAAVDFSDPVILDSPIDPGKTWHVVNIDSMAETSHIAGITSLALQMSEI